MIYWLLAIAFWTPDGSMHMMTRDKLFETEQACRQQMDEDAAVVTGTCFKAPPKPVTGAPT